MRRTGRILNAFRWAATISLFLTTGLWPFSFFRTISYYVPVTTSAEEHDPGSPPGTWPFKVYSLGPGAIELGFDGFSRKPLPSSFLLITPRRGPALFFRPIELRWSGSSTIPLWLPMVLFGIPTFWLWWNQRIRRRPSLARPLRKKNVRERLGNGVSLIISLAAATIALILSVYLEHVGFPALTTRNLEGILREEWGFSEPMYFVVFFAIVLGISYAAGRLVYRWTRWKICYDDVPQCVRCYYELTGNTSGRCPECGTPIKGTIPGPG